MDDPQEYEVESITRARVHDKKGKKITWKYYVKWKGYGWDESTWEPTDSFQGGSEHILESFWERIDTSGRDISDASAFKKGEELLISGPPGRKSLKRKTNTAKPKVLPSKDVQSSNDEAISAPPSATRKRRRVQITANAERGYSKLKRRVSTTDLKNEETSTRSTKRRRRASSPGLRKSAPKRLPSVGDSQLDADGETDPDVVEVEDELMQVSVEDAEEDNTKTRHSTKAGGSANGSGKIAFDDLEHFYGGNPIDIDQHADEQVAVHKPESRPRPQSPTPATALFPDDPTPGSQALTPPALSASESLFSSPSRLTDEAPEIQSDPTLPAHRARVANPLVKLIDTTTLETTSKQSRITAKARLMSTHKIDVPPAGPSRGVAKRGGRPGFDRSSSGLITKNRSSLLTATKGALKTVKGNFTSATVECDPDEIEEVSAVERTEGERLLIKSWSDVPAHQVVANSQPGPPPSGDELLELAGLRKDMETLPDYEDDSVTQPQDDIKPQESNLTSAPTEEESPGVGVAEGSKASDRVVDLPPSVSEAEQKAPTATADNPSSTPDPFVPLVVTSLANSAVRMNIELAKEQLFPSTQMSFDSFSSTHSSFRSTIFGPLYQGLTANHVPAIKDEPSTTFKVVLRDGAELPLVLKDCSEIKARISDILIGNSSGSKVAVFYSAVDALAMASAMKGDGTARVVLDPSARTMEQECFSAFLQRFESSQTLVAPVSKEICILYSSENTDIAEKLGAPAHLRGLSRTLLISHASIENQLAYVAAVMQATAL